MKWCAFVRLGAVAALVAPAAVAALPMPAYAGSASGAVPSAPGVGADRPTAPADAVRARAPLASERGGASPPYGCTARVGLPRETGPGTVTVRFSTRCRRVPAALSAEGALYRSAPWGWEEIGTVSGRKAKAGTLIVDVAVRCDRETGHRYRGAAAFLVAGPEGSGSANVFNQTSDRIVC